MLLGKPAYSSKQVTLYDAAGRMLYAAVVVGFIPRRGWVQSAPFPVFGRDAEDASGEVRTRMRKNRVRRFRILAVGPAIGFFAHDDNGDGLSFSPRNKVLHIARAVHQAA